jgi:hypothetical protein
MWFSSRSKKRQEEVMSALNEVSWDAEIGVATEKARAVSRETAFPDLDYLNSFALQLLRDAGALPKEVAAAALCEAVDCHKELALALWESLKKAGYVKIMAQELATREVLYWIIPSRKSYLLFAGHDGEIPLL